MEVDRQQRPARRTVIGRRRQVVVQPDHVLRGQFRRRLRNRAGAPPGRATAE
jgi:hypothetical protein